MSPKPVRQFTARMPAFGAALALLMVCAAPQWSGTASDNVRADDTLSDAKADLRDLKVTTPEPNGDETAPATKQSPSPVDILRPANLLTADLAELWEHFSSKEGVPLTDTWKLTGEGDNRNLICTGDPKGFLITKATYANFELSFEWRYKEDPEGNSGILIFTQNEPRLWPTSMQVQLHQPRAGAVFPSGDATSDNSTEATGLALEIGMWNTCVITGRAGRISVRINGRIAGEVSGCKPASGRIAIQSEGYETHFRKMVVRRLEPTANESQQTTSSEATPSEPTEQDNDAASVTNATGPDQE